ncbi:MAG: TlyA family RNA methyltransferase [Verrucomicrobiae bacterium]|nr:TlyA family RNA methyltransferase [Verrucomicrobiae bacterium]
MSKQRIDILLVERGLVESREKAKALVMAGEVMVNQKKVFKASETFDAQVEIIVKTPERYVSRGGLKLEHALKHFSVPVLAKRVLDIGASTGGFTDCLLQHGAAEVVALDVGQGQLHWKLRQDARVKVVEGKNARHLAPGELGDLFDMAVMDVSFISQTLLWPRIAEQLKPEGLVIALIKPQFELKADEVGKGGVVREESLRQQAVKRISNWLSAETNFEILGVVPSPILGKEGNQEFLLCARLLIK